MGTACKLKHTRECPQYAANGTCNRVRCTLTHQKAPTKKKKEREKECSKEIGEEVSPILPHFLHSPQEPTFDAGGSSDEDEEVSNELEEDQSLEEQEVSPEYLKEDEECPTPMNASMDEVEGVSDQEDSEEHFSIPIPRFLRPS